ncbi:putative HTH-type transcriptional regulator YcgE [Reticulibacter mediterranei]|uniref:Putative HTH-type transcriptional regulator YcgE n=1 Tax=Reticulibacter mediterranei TaxID=2778369 RepID=A0A8J3IUV5_9CHLR|nr:MarR family transcriptional regulator [Reticulibacter mediterranei]GHO98953.1 putative HTH-type transcriptional regulator YcgE [Reticulibacter mediterranei]
MSSHPEPRERLIEIVRQASRESSTMAVFFHTRMAERVGLGATEEKTLALLGKRGPLTAGEIAAHTGLTTPSVTGLLDRLESKGMVRRVRDSHDRRRVIVEPNQERLAELDQMFSSVQEAFHEMLDIYSDEQLATIADFLIRSAQRTQEFMAAQWGKQEER